MDISKCGQCNDMFTNRKDLNMHRLTAHIANLVKVACPHCNVYYDDLEQHMQASHGATGPVCPYCAVVGKRSWALKLHIEQVHLNIQIHKPAACPICKKVFVKKGHMERHVKMVHEGIREGSQPCKYCGKELCNKAALEKHEAMVHEGVREECPVCHKVLCDLYKHMRIVHGTYQRKAKLPRDCLDRLDDPTFNIVPKIYGAAPSRKHLDSMKPVTGLRSFKAVEQRQNVIGSLGKRTLDNQQKRTSFVSSLPVATNSSLATPKSSLNTSPTSTNQNLNSFSMSNKQSMPTSATSFQEIINVNFAGSLTSRPSTNSNSWEQGINKFSNDSTKSETDLKQQQMRNPNKRMKQETDGPASQIKIKEEPIDLENDDFISVIASIFNTPPLIKLEPEDQDTDGVSNFFI